MRRSFEGQEERIERREQAGLITIIQSVCLSSCLRVCLSDRRYSGRDMCDYSGLTALTVPDPALIVRSYGAIRGEMEKRGS